MNPTRLDSRAIQSLAQLQTKPFCVEAADILSQAPLVNGLVYAVPLFLLWHSADPELRLLGHRMMLTILVGTMIGVLGSLLLQLRIRRPPPAANPALARVFAFSFREYFRVHPNPNSFPSDSAMLYSTVAFGLAAWSHGLSIGLLAWLFILMAPAKVFVGGHYPTDILAGVLLGFISYRLADYVMMNSPHLGALASNQSRPLTVALFAWLFEIGNEFRDVRHVASAVGRIRRHVWSQIPLAVG